ncbi:MAG: hypothetical protein KAR07_03395 [Spirochaetes bacterium]|nr:hypothetical protein [Spirochaetota bacterium]MCK5267189.1 hypothetical protein [Spirochaetota bacterium]
MNKKQFDNVELYCRMLGHHVPFKYCRTSNDNGACGKIRDCWSSRIDIDTFLNESLTENEKKSIGKPSAPKILSIYEIMKNAQKLNRKNDNEDKS